MEVYEVKQIVERYDSLKPGFNLMVNYKVSEKEITLEARALWVGPARLWVMTHYIEFLTAHKCGYNVYLISPFLYLDKESLRGNKMPRVKRVKIEGGKIKNLGEREFDVKGEFLGIGHPVDIWAVKSSGKISIIYDKTDENMVFLEEMKKSSPSEQNIMIKDINLISEAVREYFERVDKTKDIMEVELYELNGTNVYRFEIDLYDSIVKPNNLQLGEREWEGYWNVDLEDGYGFIDSGIGRLVMEKIRELIQSESEYLMFAKVPVYENNDIVTTLTPGMICIEDGDISFEPILAEYCPDDYDGETKPKIIAKNIEEMSLGLYPILDESLTRQHDNLVILAEEDLAPLHGAIVIRNTRRLKRIKNIILSNFMV